MWEPDLFFTNEDRADGRLRPAVRPIDVTGRARILIFGPYINLPPGRGRRQSSPPFGGNGRQQLCRRGHRGVQLGYERVQPAGEQVINLQFTIDESISQPDTPDQRARGVRRAPRPRLCQPGAATRGSYRNPPAADRDAAPLRTQAGAGITVRRADAGARGPRRLPGEPGPAAGRRTAASNPRPIGRAAAQRG